MSFFWTNKELQEMVMKAIGVVPFLGKLEERLRSMVGYDSQ